MSQETWPNGSSARMVQALVIRFAQDDLRDDMTILAARVRAG